MFGPLVSLLAGVYTDPRFAVGPFTYRVAPYLDLTHRSKHGIVGPREIQAYLPGAPPAAILTGFSGAFDHRLEAWENANDYQQIKLPNQMRNAVLFRRCLIPTENITSTLIK